MKLRRHSKLATESQECFTDVGARSATAPSPSTAVESVPLGCREPLPSLLLASSSKASRSVVPELPCRTELARALFHTLDATSTGCVDRSQLFRFAKVCGFKGSDDEWSAEWEMLSARYGFSTVGMSVEQFVQLLNDKKGSVQCTDEDLALVQHSLRNSAPMRFCEADMLDSPLHPQIDL